MVIIDKIVMSEEDKEKIKIGNWYVSKKGIRTAENSFPQGTKFRISAFREQHNPALFTYSYVHRAHVRNELIIEMYCPIGELHTSYHSERFFEEFEELSYKIKRFSLFGYIVDIYKYKIC